MNKVRKNNNISSSNRMDAVLIDLKNITRHESRDHAAAVIKKIVDFVGMVKRIIIFNHYWCFTPKL